MNKPKTYGDDFRARISKIEVDAKARGLNWTSICKETGVSRATPDRWKRKLPMTIQVVERMEEMVQRHPVLPPPPPPAE